MQLSAMLACPMPELALPCPGEPQTCLSDMAYHEWWLQGWRRRWRQPVLFIYLQEMKAKLGKDFGKVQSSDIKYCFKKPQGHLCWHLDKDFIEVTGLGDGLVVSMITGEGGIYVLVKNFILLWLMFINAHLLGCWIKEANWAFSSHLLSSRWLPWLCWHNLMKFNSPTTHQYSPGALSLHTVFSLRP